MKAIFLSDKEYAGIVRYGRTMEEIFSDEGRSDYFDGDDAARMIAEVIMERIESPYLPMAAGEEFWRDDVDGCPECGGVCSRDDCDYGEGDVYERMRCWECGHRWSDVYIYAYSSRRR